MAGKILNFLKSMTFEITKNRENWQDNKEAKTLDANCGSYFLLNSACNVLLKNS